MMGEILGGMNERMDGTRMGWIQPAKGTARFGQAPASGPALTAALRRGKPVGSSVLSPL